jgi:hypothetical protein
MPRPILFTLQRTASDKEIIMLLTAYPVVGTIITMLTIGLLVCKEFLRGMGAREAHPGMRALNIVLVPLILAFFLLVAQQMMHFSK